MLSEFVLKRENLTFLLHEDVDTLLDKMIKDSWSKKMEQGYFKYTLETLKTKQVGKFVAQLNPMRATTRRKPEPMQRVDQEFSHSKFNFTKARIEEENMFQVLQQDDNDLKNSVERDFILINVSPIEFGHCLLIPALQSCLPQHLTLHSIEMALRMVASSGRKNFKMAFNSLCAYASVNHLHWHMYYLNENFDLFLERAQAEKLTNDCFVLTPESGHGQGFAFQIAKSEEIPQIANLVRLLVDFFNKTNIAHNVFVTRGTPFEEPNSDALSVLRIFVWARESAVGEKDPGAFVIAVCELSGQLLIYNEEKFNSITEQEISDALQETCEKTFIQVRPQVLRLLEEMRTS